MIVVAEGAGQDLMATSQERDASGNVKYGDIGVFLRDAIKDHFKRTGTAITLKYIDPSYTIRSVPATAHDSAFCLLLGQSAVHAGISGRTNMVVSFWNHQFTHVPISLAVSERKKIDPEGALWSSRARIDRSAAGHARPCPGGGAFPRSSPSVTCSTRVLLAVRQPWSRSGL